MGCLKIADLYQHQVDAVIGIAGTVVTYYPAVLTGYSTSTQARVPVETGPVSVPGIFGEEKVNAPDGAVTYSTTFTLAAGSFDGEPSPGDRVVHQNVSYRVVELRRAWFGSVLSNYVLTLSN